MQASDAMDDVAPPPPPPAAVAAANGSSSAAAANGVNGVNGTSVKTTTSATPEPLSRLAPAKKKKPKSFSWLDPHPTFVIVFVGKEERPFGLQKDFLCAKSVYFRDYFSKKTSGSTSTPAPTAETTAADTPDEKVENIVHLPDITPEAFAYAQHYMYTGQVVPEESEDDDNEDDDDAATDAADDDRTRIPSYDVLVSIWKLGHRLGIHGLCERTLEVMAENKRLTMTIPATATLVRVWHDTPEGSSIRQLLLSWAAEYLRSSEARRAAFAKALPQELLSELVVAMSSSYGDFWSMPAAFGGSGGGGGGGKDGEHDATMHDDDNTNGSYHTPISIGTARAPPAKRARYFESYATTTTTTTTSAHGAPEPTMTMARSTILPPNNVNGGRKGGGRASMPGPRAFSSSSSSVVPSPAAAAALAAAANLSGSPSTGPVPTPPGSASAPGPIIIKKRGYHHHHHNHQAVDLDAFSAAQKLRFCDDLLTRMLSGPGFWTRLVGPFREPVDPVTSGVPDYFDKVKRPMDLGTIKANLDNGRYAGPEEFLADMRQIFSNAYTYWKRGDAIWLVCERLEKTFEEKYAQMNKWLAKLEGEELG